MNITTRIFFGSRDQLFPYKFIKPVLHIHRPTTIFYLSPEKTTQFFNRIMARSPQNSSSAHASHNNCFIRHVHNSENRRAPYRTVRRRRHQRPPRNNTVGKITIRFNGTAYLQTPLLMVGTEPFSTRHGNRLIDMPTQAARPQNRRVTGVRISASPRAGNNNPQPPGSGSHVPFTGVQIPAAVRPITDGYNPLGPGARLTPQAYVDGPTTLQAHPSIPTYDPQAAPPPNLAFLPTAATNAFTGEFFPPANLHQQLPPPLPATVANNASAGEFLPPATCTEFPAARDENYVDMLLQTSERYF